MIEVPDEIDSDIDELELLQAQLDQLYNNYKERRAANEKKYLQELEKRKGLPAQKLREQVRNGEVNEKQNKLNELIEKETEVNKEAILQKAKEEEEELERESGNEENEGSEESEGSEDESEGSEDESEGDDDTESAVPAELRRQRWFSDPMFANLSQSEDSESDDEMVIAGIKQRKSQKRELPLEERLKAYSRGSRLS